MVWGSLEAGFSASPVGRPGASPQLTCSPAPQRPTSVSCYCNRVLRKRVGMQPLPSPLPLPQDQLHNLLGPVQNKNTGPLVLKMVKTFKTGPSSSCGPARGPGSQRHRPHARDASSALPSSVTRTVEICKPLFKSPYKFPQKELELFLAWPV